MRRCRRWAGGPLRYDLSIHVKHIEYRMHSALLTGAGLMLVLTSERMQLGVNRLIVLVAMAGLFHAASVALTLQPRPPRMRSLLFLGIAAVLSIGTPILALALSGPILDLLSSSSNMVADVGVIVIFVLAVALGTAAYWLLIRWYWLDWLSGRDLRITLLACILAVIVSFSITPYATAAVGRDAGLIPFLAWWAAFSWSLAYNETRRIRAEKNKTSSRARVAG